MYGRKAGTVRCFYADAQTTPNGCGQAAVATCLYEYGMLTNAATAVQKIYNRSPPDTTIRQGMNFGSTPGHVENIAKLHKLKTVRFDGRSGAGADFQVNQVKHHLKLNRLVILLMDNGKLMGSWGGHYIVAYGYDNRNIFCVNMINRSQVSGHSIDNATFKDAWHVWFIPSDEFHYSGIAVWKA